MNIIVCLTCAKVQLKLEHWNRSEKWNYFSFLIKQSNVYCKQTFTASLSRRGTQQFFLYGQASPRRLAPYLFIYHFSRERYPFRIPYIEQWYPFHIPCLELCNPFNCCKCTCGSRTATLTLQRAVNVQTTTQFTRSIHRNSFTRTLDSYHWLSLQIADSEAMSEAVMWWYDAIMR